MLKASVYKIALLATILCTISVAMIDQRTPGLMKLYTSTPNQGLIISINGNVGIGTMAPSTKLEVAGTVSASALVVNGALTVNKLVVSGSVAIPIETTTATSYTLTASNGILLVNTAVDMIITLPDPALAIGRQFTIKKINTSNSKITLSGTDVPCNLFTPSQYVIIASDGIIWYRIGGN